MEKNRTVVRIASQEFRLTGRESEEYMQKLAVCVNKRIEEIQGMYPSLGVSNCVILAALNMADELHKAKEDYEALDARISELRDMPRVSAPIAPMKRPFASKQPAAGNKNK